MTYTFNDFCFIISDRVFGSNYIGIIIAILTINFVILYLDGFNLSKNTLIKCIQIFLLASIFLVVLLLVYNQLIHLDTSSNIICNVGNINNEIGTKVNLEVHVDGQAGRPWAATGTIGVVTAFVGKAVVKSSIPPLQKAGAIVGAAAAAGVIQAGVNYSDSRWTSSNVASTSTNINSNVNKFMPESSPDFSPLQGVLWSVETLDYICLSVIYILIIQLVFKLYLKHSINLNFSNLLGNNINKKVEFYLNKTIMLNKQMSVFWIWFIFAILAFSLGSTTYFTYRVDSNIGHFVNTHNTTNINILPTAYTSIGDGLFNLEVANLICLVILISLIVVLFSRFHLSKSIQSIYIWVLVISLVISLAYSAYISGELHTNIDSYINIYKNIVVNANVSSGTSLNDSISKNYLFDPFIQLINNYKEFISNLTVEQLACLFNLIGFVTIFIVLNSVFLAYFGDKIINYFNLEVKIPKLSKFIQIRRKILNNYINFHIIYIYIVSIIFICVNTYMFFT